MWLFKFGCELYEASTHVHSGLMLSTPSNLLSLILCLKNFITQFSFDFYSTVILVTLVQINDIASLLSGIAPFPTHIFFATIYCRVSASCLSSLGDFLFIFYKLFLAGDANFAYSASPNDAMDSSL